MRLFIVIVLCVLLGAACAQNALAEGKCMEFSVSPDGNMCQNIKSYNVMIGPVVVSGTNTGTARVQLGWNFQGWPEPRFQDITNGESGTCSARSVFLDPGKRNETILLSPTSTVLVGVLIVGFTADSPEALRGLAAPTVTSPPVVSEVIGAAGSVKGPLAPGEIVTISGSFLTDNGCSETSPEMPLSSTLCGTTLTIDGHGVPLYYVSEGQIYAQVPFEMAIPATIDLQVVRNSIVGNVMTVEVRETSPSLFTREVGGVQIVAVSDAVTGALTTLRAGKEVVLWASGLGHTTHDPQAGEESPNDAQVLVPVHVTVDGVEFPVKWAGLASGTVGLYQVEAQVPESFLPKQSLVTGVISVGTASSSFSALATVIASPSNTGKVTVTTSQR